MKRLVLPQYSWYEDKDTGFSGTGKIIVPGISSIQTIADTHFEASVGAREKGINPASGLGKWEESDMRKERSFSWKKADAPLSCLVPPVSWR